MKHIRRQARNILNRTTKAVSGYFLHTRRRTEPAIFIHARQNVGGSYTSYGVLRGFLLIKTSRSLECALLVFIASPEKKIVFIALPVSIRFPLRHFDPSSIPPIRAPLVFCVSRCIGVFSFYQATKDDANKRGSFPVKLHLKPAR